MEVERTNVECDLNAGPTDATIPRALFRSILRRVEIKVTAKGSSQSDVELVNGIKAIMVKLQEADKSIIILPYGAAHANLKALKKSLKRSPRVLVLSKNTFRIRLQE